MLWGVHPASSESLPLRIILAVALVVLLLPSTSALELKSIGGAPNAPLPGHHVTAQAIAGTAMPEYRPPHLPVHPQGSGVNPYLYHTSEPAPIGITDYGIDGSGNPYEYSTPSFAGQVQVNSLSSYNASLSDPHSIGFQLNVNTYLSAGSYAYVYWVQDVAILNLSTDTILFLDNVWNSTSVGSGMTSSGISGNGSIGTSSGTPFYYDFASASFPGVGVSLSFPTNITLEVVASDNSGTPDIAFEFNDGYGWVTYDNVAFPSARGFLDYGFVVDGYAYKLQGGYLDAELIMGGPGGGSQTTISSTDVQLSLYYWNGYNFQEVLNAYNFGSDTAEGLNNGLSAGYYYLKNGSLFAEVTSAAGTLGVLYDDAFDAVVNITTPVDDGVLYINGTEYGPFYGDEVNVTVGPGTYQFSIYLSGALVASKVATISSSTYYSLRIGFGALFSVTFAETGLPAGTAWSVTLGTTTLNSTTTSITFTEPNGSQAYSVGPVAGYTVTPATGTAAVTGRSITVDLAWTEEQFVVTFTESGLPVGTSWSVTLAGSTVSSTGDSIEFAEFDGTYTYSIGEVAGYRAGVWSGTVPVSNANTSIQVGWTQVTYPVWFNESGLPAGASWQLDLREPNGYLNRNYSTPSVSALLPNGTYQYGFVGPTPYTASPGTGALTLAGSDQSVSVTFSIPDGSVRGRVSPSSASIWIGAVMVTTTNGSFDLNETPGAVSIEVTASGYQPFFANVTVNPGVATWENVTLTPTTSTGGPMVAGIPTYAVVGLVGALVVVVAIAAVVLTRRSRMPPAGASPPSGATR